VRQVADPVGYLPDVSWRHQVLPVVDVNGTALADQKQCLSANECAECPLGGPIGRCGLIWIGEKFYATPLEWTLEARSQGVSRRLPNIPNGVEIGKTWVLVAHRRCITNEDGTFSPGVFHAFKVQRIEYVVTGTESAEKIDSLVKKGVTPVNVVPVEAVPV
jgi:hypothetical protein